MKKSTVSKSRDGAHAPKRAKSPGKTRKSSSPAIAVKAAAKSTEGKAVEAARLDAMRWEHYRTVPQKHYIEMAGRQAKTINEQALRWNLPCNGAVIDLAAVIHAFHDFLAANHKKLAAKPANASKARLENAKADLAEMEAEEKRKTHCDLNQLDKALSMAWSHLRSAGEILQRKYGLDAADVFNSCITEAEESWRREYAAITGGVTDVEGSH